VAIHPSFSAIAKNQIRPSSRQSKHFRKITVCRDGRTLRLYYTPTWNHFRRNCLTDKQKPVEENLRFGKLSRFNVLLASCYPGTRIEYCMARREK